VIGLDALRLVVLIPLCLVFGATLTVLRLYWRAWRELPAERARLTPVHVALVSAGVLLLTSALAWALIAGFRDRPLDAFAAVRLSMYGVGALAILAALWVIGGIQRRRVRFERHIEVHVAEPDEEADRRG
jgi:hypothetical protein